MSESQSSPAMPADHDPSDLSPAALVERFLQRRETDSTDRTLRSYESRLERFLAWCETEDITAIGDLSPWLLDEFGLHVRDQGDSPATVKGVLATTRVFLKYAAEIGAVDDGIPEAVPVPTLDPSEETSDERLAPADAEAALAFFRESTARFGTNRHAFLELAWHTGARVGGLRALDRGDCDLEAQTVHIRHRPNTGTPLKNKSDGERIVGISDPVCEALEHYFVRERPETRDDHGREPLFATRQGRASFSTLRAWSYQAVQPCLWMDCPHGKQRERCEWTERAHCSKCPSSRSPHQLRTGSITWQLNRGLSIEVVAERVNATPSVIRRYYDKASQQEAFEERRQQMETSLDIQESNE